MSTLWSETLAVKSKKRKWCSSFLFRRQCCDDNLCLVAIHKNLRRLRKINVCYCVLSRQAKLLSLSLNLCLFLWEQIWPLTPFAILPLAKIHTRPHDSYFQQTHLSSSFPILFPSCLVSSEVLRRRNHFNFISVKVTRAPERRNNTIQRGWWELIELCSEVKSICHPNMLTCQYEE